jgi:hypothetical protein
MKADSCELQARSGRRNRPIWTWYKRNHSLNAPTGAVAVAFVLFDDGASDPC